MNSQLTQFLLGKAARAMLKREENSVGRMAAVSESFLVSFSPFSHWIWSYSLFRAWQVKGGKIGELWWKAVFLFLLWVVLGGFFTLDCHERSRSILCQSAGFLSSETSGHVHPFCPAGSVAAWKMRWDKFCMEKAPSLLGFWFFGCPCPPELLRRMLLPELAHVSSWRCVFLLSCCITMF